MNALVEDIRRIILSVSAQPRQAAITTLKGVPGRGPNGFGIRFKAWLESGPSAFSEPVTVECVDHMSDHGIDVLVTGQLTGTRIGVQIKSDNDVTAGEFTSKAKAQLTDAQAWGLSEIVLVIACQPTDKHEKTYLHLFNELQRWPKQEILICLPERAAALFAAFGVLMVPPPRSRSWPELLAKLGQSDIAAILLDRWPKITPTSRFVAPREFSAIADSVDANPVTIISGPPASGKTFSALQLLMRAFEAGREPIWIAPTVFQPTAGPLTELSAPPDLKTRIDLLARKLGVTPRLPPLDATEFAAVALRPTSTVFIEDPFGKTDDSYAYSLHTYSFFDFDYFVELLCHGKPRASCRIIVTTREALFERWIDERGQNGKSLPDGISVITIGPRSYSPRGIRDLAAKLLREGNAGIADGVVDEAAAQLASPYEVELVAYAAAGGSAPLVALQDYKDGLQRTLSGRLVPVDDGERLFLLLLAALAGNGLWKSDFAAHFAALYSAIADGNADTVLASAQRKYRVLFARFLGGGTLGMSRWFHLEPVHSTVRDEIKRTLSAFPSFLETVACNLPAMVHPLSTQTPAAIGLYLLTLGAAQQQGKAAAAIVSVLMALSYTSPHAYQLASIWSTLDVTVREMILSGLEKKPALLPELVAASGTKKSTFPPQDAWRMVRALLGDQLGSKRMWPPHPHPWRFVFENISTMPADIRIRFDELASTRPSVFIFAFGDAIVEFWDASPELWRAALETPAAIDSEHAQRRVLPTIIRDWEKADQRLRDLVRRQVRNQKHQIRAILGTWALIRYEDDVDEFTPIVNTIADDADIRVPLEVIDEGVGDDAHDQAFVERVAARVDGPSAAALLSRVAAPYKPLSAWRCEVTKSCLKKGGRTGARRRGGTWAHLKPRSRARSSL
ncbi:hypothetical protein [Sorangium sp. So ce542]|uniref:hypothetical protein n=1 Tax=Sorangium sp. So ce542 TaxID=3133316 RepID=UPI003F6335EB